MAKKISSIILAIFLTFVMVVNISAPAVYATAANGQAVSIVTTGPIKVDQKLAAKKKLKIVTQPTTVVVPSKKTAKVTVKASGDKVKYRWYYKDSGKKKYTKSSVTKSYYSVKMSKKVNNRKVYCLITDKYGKKLKTKVVSLKMGKTLKISTQPKSITVLSGQTAKVTTKAVGDSVKYRWYYKDAGKSKYTKSSVTKSYYSVKMSSSIARRMVYCLITDKYGISLKTNVVTLTMGKTLKITAQPQSVVVRKNAVATVNVVVYGDGVKYEWYYKDTNATAFTKATSKSNTYSVNMTSAVSGREVYCKITDVYGKTVTSNTVTLTMATELTIANQPESQTVYCGSNANISVEAIGDGLKYQWYVKKVSDTEFVADTTATSKNYEFLVDETFDGAQVYCIVTDKYGVYVTSQIATITAATPLNITTQPESQIVYCGSKSDITISATGDELEYKWYVKKAGDTDFAVDTDFTNNAFDVVVDKTYDGAKVYCVVTDKYGSSLESEVVTITAATVLQITTQPKSQAVYCGSDASIFVEAEGDGLEYKWYVKKSDDADFAVDTNFTTNRYTQNVDYSFDGAQVYCVITDKYGSFLTTETATITAATVLSITTRPASETTVCGTQIGVVTAASGDGLTYEWHIKKANDAEFSIDTEYTGTRYNATASNVYDGTELYCVISDKYGSSVTTNTVTVTVEHNYDNGVVTDNPTCQKKGTKLFSCGTCPASYTEGIDTVDHDMSEWSIVTDPTPYEQGLERQVCKFDCGFKNEKPLEIVEAVYNITVYTDEETYYFVGVGENGKYSLEEPTKFGYVFKGWQGANNEPFETTGKVYQNVSIRAIWEADDTDTKEKLLARVNAGVEEIKIASDIVVDEPIYITNKTTVYADANYSLVRATDYAGDIFVVGQDAEGNFSILDGVNATLTLGGGEGELTIDGNCENTTVDVNGALVFAADSSFINLYDGIKLANNNKITNKRTTDLDYGDYISKSVLERVGGAGIVNLNSTIFMYGGVIENNTVKTVHTQVPGATEEDPVQNKEIDGCGGGIYNHGNIHMYGGTIDGNTALRGGGIYNDRILYIYAGTVSNNKSYTYGGAVSSSSSSNADMYLGTEDGNDSVVISGNQSVSAGGALYSNTSSPIVIYGNTEFTNNRSETSGGAIYTGGTLTLTNAKFSGNTCNYSGGAIYHHYSNADYTRRIFDVDDCEFTENQSSCGGAVTLSASSAVEGEGTEAYFDNCTFTKNEVIPYGGNAGNGGAIYVTRSSDVIVNNCSFKDNSASNAAGAISVHSNASLDVTKSEFESNTALHGGAIYSTSNSTVDILESNFTSNATVETEPDENDKTKVGNGGALYLYNATVSINKVGMYNNSSCNNAGAFYIGGKDVTIDSTCEFVGNTAANHGGAIYVTYQTKHDEETDTVEKIGSAVTINGAKLEDNTALSGGAISARSYSDITIKNTEIKGNVTPNAKVGEDQGGGAIYINNSDLDINNVEFTENASGYYGGVIKAGECNINVTETNFIGGSGGTGAVMYAAKSTLIANSIRVEDNTSTLNGFFYFNKTDATFNNLTANENTGVFGTIYAANNSVVDINDSEFCKNKLSSGGAVYVVSGATIDLNNTKINDNTAKNQGGAAYVIGATLNINKDTVISNNSASSAGAVYATTEDLAEDGSYKESVINVTEAQITDNEATVHGGAMYVIRTDLNVNNKSIVKNNVSGKNGGGIYLSHSTVDIVGESTEITNNSAKEHGGAFYVVYQEYGEEGQKVREGGTLNITNALVSGNTALNGGAISARTNSNVSLSNMTLSNNSTPDAEVDKDQGGGAIYANNSQITLSNVNVKGNSSGYYAGAIKTMAAHLTLNNGTIFQENSGATGAVMHLSTNSSLDADNVVISNNESTANGLLYLNGSDFNINNLTANNNESAWNSGLLYINGSNTNVNISNSNISQNKTVNGGAIYTLNGSTNVTNTTFAGNIATDGGAIYAEKGTVTLGEGTVIENNTITGKGGAVFAKNNATINVDAAKINNNTAGNGGAVFLQGAVLKTSANAQFNENIATAHGGAVYINEYIDEKVEDAIPVESDVEIKYASFSENTAKRGGAIYSTSSTYLVASTEFSNNTATDDNYGGGAIYSTVSFGELSDVVFAENSSVKGGAVALHSKSEMNISSLEATKNDAYVNTENKLGIGGVFYVNNSTLNLNGTELSVKLGAEDNGNTAATGGAICVENGAILSVAGTEFIDNSASKLGGAISASSSIVTSISESSFLNNDTASGGVVRISKSTVNSISGNTFSNNTGTQGGAMNINESPIEMFNGNNFLNNSSSNGGAIYIYGGNTITSFADNTFKGNTTAGNGGAVYMVGITINASQNNVFEGNVAENHGGAIYVTYINNGDNTYIGGVLNMADGLFNNNVAIAGGAVSIRSHSEATFDGTEFENNSVEGDDGTPDGNAEGGGAIYVGFATLNLNNVAATENTAESFGGFADGYSSTINVVGGAYNSNRAANGGVFYVLSNTKLNVEGAEFNNNKSTFQQELNSFDNTKGGGTIDMMGGELMVKSSTFDGNETGYYGGTILAHGTKVNIEDSVITNSVGKTGAAVGFLSTSLTIKDSSITSTVGSGSGVMYIANGTATLENVTASGNNSYNGGAMYISGSAKITIDDSAFACNKATNSGGAIDNRSSGTISINNTNFNENTAKLGGAIYSTKGTVTLTNSTLSNNTAASGGAIYSETGTVTIGEGTVVDGNEASSKGGAVAATNKSTLNVNGATLSNNKSVLGGSLHILGASLNIGEQTQLLKNTSTGTGGAIYVGKYISEDETPVEIEAEVEIANATFSENTATRGGAIYVSNSSYSVEDSEFIKNTATDESYGGGAIYSTTGVGELSGATFTENSSVKGGAVALHSTSEVNISSLQAINNTAQTNTENKLGVGGVFYVNNSTLNINGTELSAKFGAQNAGNTATSGGAIYAENNSFISISGAEFTENVASKLGGAVYVSATTVNAFKDNAFVGNSSESNGGAVNIVGSTINATGENTFDSNSAVNHGGAIYITYTDKGNSNYIGGILNMTGGIFKNNTALGGGAVSIRSHSEATFDGTEFKSNSVEGCNQKDGVDAPDGDGEGGGAIYVGFATLNLNNVTATENTAEVFGGVIDSISSTINVSGGTYSDNYAENGGVFYNISSTKLNIEDAEFNNNKSTFDNSSTWNSSIGGGVINMFGGTLTINSSVFDGNESDYYGGTILADGTKVTIQENSEFKNSKGKTGSAIGIKNSPATIIKDIRVTNTVGSGNGVIYIAGGTATLTNITASDNASTNGGALYISSNASVTVQDSTFTKNIVTGTGGAIDHRASKALNILNTTISENTAKTGGAMYSAGSGAITISGCTIKDNTATSKGGAIYADISSSNITVSDDTLFKNNAAPNGGAVYLDKGAKFNVINSEFDGNNATSGIGGAIVVAESTADVDLDTTFSANGVTFKNNTASDKGGAIATGTNCPNIVINVENCLFENNSSTAAGGGAVAVQNKNQPDATDPEQVNIVFTNCEFTGNTAKTTGGAVEIRTSSCAKFDGVTATNNNATSNGGVFYVTSDYSRLYITGTVTNSGNTSASGNFAYLYKSGTYNAPPKIYTTHSNTASWVADVKGNSSNIAFDLVTLP